MKLVLRQLPRTIRGTSRLPFLAQDAADALVAIEKDTDGLIYTDMWRDPTMSLLSRRMKKTSQLPGYSPHNFGLAVDIDVKAILEEKKIRYEDLLRIMKKRGWICFRRDGLEGPDYDHFNFLGEFSAKYLTRCTLDPTTWGNAAEYFIWERFGKELQLETRDVQLRLTALRFYTGPITGMKDLYTREAILAFQRAWDLIQSGSPDMTTCRVLAFVTAERELSPAPAWA